jgi:myosin VIIa
VLLGYGDLPPNVVMGKDSFSKTPYSSYIQNMISRCLAQPRFVDELYLQLIKLTSEHPDPEGWQSMQFWRLFSICVGAVSPPTPEILDYLKCHLR